MDISDRMRKTI